MSVRLLIAGTAAVVTLAVPTAAFAQTQVFRGDGPSAQISLTAAKVSLQSAGYTPSQCTFRTTVTNPGNFETTATCTR